MPRIARSAILPQEAVVAAAAADTPSATKAVRKAAKQSAPRLTMEQRIAAAIAIALPQAMAALQPQSAPPADTPIPDYLSAQVAAGIISAEQAQAIANNPAFKAQQQAAADHIPSPVLVQEVRKHKPAGVIIVRKGNRNVELFSYPIATKPATGNDYTDRDAMGFHKAKSLLMVIDQLRKFVEASELKRSAE